MEVSHVLLPGNPIKKNEDALYVGEHVFAVFDGATSLDGYIDSEGNTGGYHASHIAQNIFESYEKDVPLLSRANKANEAIKAAMLQADVDIHKKESLWSTTFAAVAIKEDIIEWAQIADALILFIHEDGTYTLPISNYDHDVETLTLWHSYDHLSREEKWKNTYDTIVKNRRMMNEMYGTLSGDSRGLEFIHSGKISKNIVSHILLFTDGLIPPKEDPQGEDSFDELVSTYLASGLEAAVEYVRSTEATDPECSIYPRFKQHDDIAAIAIRL